MGALIISILQLRIGRERVRLSAAGSGFYPWLSDSGAIHYATLPYRTGELPVVIVFWIYTSGFATGDGHRFAFRNGSGNEVKS